MKRYITALMMSALIISTAYASTDLGFAAGNMHSVTSMIGGIMEVIMYVAGVAVFVSATMKYRLHRQNPQQVHISTPITELVLSIILILIPIVTRYGNEDVLDSAPPQQSTQQNIRRLPD